MRLVYGGLLIPYGYKKLLDFGARSSTFADPFHIGSPLSMGLVIFAELFCAAFVVLGLFTRLAAIPPMSGLSVALFHAHKGDVFGQGGNATMFLAAFITILLIGPGKFSLDKVIGK
jgi:putative oxidoreductase